MNGAISLSIIVALVLFMDGPISGVQRVEGLIQPCDINEGVSDNPRCGMCEYCVLRETSGGMEAYLCIKSQRCVSENVYMP